MSDDEFFMLVADMKVCSLNVCVYKNNMTLFLGVIAINLDLLLYSNWFQV